MASKLDYGCQKCNPEDPGAFSDTYRLAGEFRARLCIDHVNAWHEFIVKQPEYEDACAAAITAEVCRNGAVAMPAVETAKVARELELKCYHVAKRWVASKDVPAAEVNRG